jgi:hypothetical protein
MCTGRFYARRKSKDINPPVSHFRRKFKKENPSPFGACAKNRVKHKKRKTGIQK